MLTRRRRRPNGRILAPSPPAGRWRARWSGVTGDIWGETVAMNLNRRIAKLEDAAAVRPPPEPVFSDQDLAAMQRIVERTYADPMRYARRIAIFEQCGMARVTDDRQRQQ